jgi:oligoendopeptidase F
MRGTFYRQAMFAEFELAVHDKAEAGEGLSGEKFTAIYLDLLKRYHGPKVAIDPSYASEWAYIPHFYTSFYVYQYATCISAASYFARSILKGGAKERDNYLSVLKAGGSDYPVDILKRAGLDMASPAPYQAMVATFKDTLRPGRSADGYRSPYARDPHRRGWRRCAGPPGADTRPRPAPSPPPGH